jgi:hypothetical protein
MGRPEQVGLFIYFRVLANPVLRDPIGLAGIIHLIANPGWHGATLCFLALLISFAVLNGRLFRRAVRDKRALLARLARHEGSVYRRLPPESIRRYFDFSFLIPSLYRPEWMQSYFAKHRWHVLLVKRGSCPRPPRFPTAHVSPISLDAYIFVRDSLDEIGPDQQFLLAHELGHAAGMFGINAQRNEIGLLPIYLSVGWTLLHAPTSVWLVAWSLAQLVSAGLIDAFLFHWYRTRERFFAEIIADYVAVRHLTPAMATELLRRGLAVHDRDLNEEQNNIRRRILLENMTRQSNNEEIDVPNIYLNYTFRYPWPLTAFIAVHFAYLAFFAVDMAPSLLVNGLLAFIAISYYIIMALQDGAARNALSQIIRPDAAKQPVPTGPRSS